MGLRFLELVRSRDSAGLHATRNVAFGRSDQETLKQLAWLGRSRSSEYHQPPSFSLVPWLMHSSLLLFQRLPSLETSAGYFSQLCFFWFDPMIARGHQKSLVDDDLWELAPDDDTRYAHRQFTALAAKYPNTLRGLVMKCFLATRHFLWKQFLYSLASTVLYFSVGNCSSRHPGNVLRSNVDR